MGLFKREKKSIDNTSNAGSSMPDVFFSGSIGMTMSSQARDGYGGNSYVKGAIDLIAGAVSSVPPIIRNLRGEEIEDKNHPLMRLIRETNPQQSWEEYIDDFTHNLLIFGNGYGFPLKTIKGIDSLWSINAQKIRANPSNNIFAPVSYWMVNTGVQTLNVMPDDLIHVKMYNPSDDILGLSPIASAGRMVEMQNSIMEWNISMARNGCKPSMTVLVPDRMSKEQFDEFIRRLNQSYGGKDNTGKGMVLDGGKTVDKSGFTAVEMDFMNGITMTGRGIAMSLKVPPELLGDSASKTYANAQEANKEFAKHTVLPILDMIYGAHNRMFTRAYKDVAEFTFDIEALDDLNVDAGTLIPSLNIADFLTLNEKREKLGYDNIGKDADVIMVPMGKIPLDQAVEGYDIPMDDEDARNV